MMPEQFSWLDPARFPPALNPSQRAWLTNPESLTRLLTRRADGRFRVRLLHQGPARLRDDECQALGVPAGEEGWAREVLLCGRETPWVYARSVVDARTLASPAFDLPSLGERPLGELLFRDPETCRRGPLQASPYPVELLPAEIRADGLWARRSCFQHPDCRLLVTEVFLPPLWQAPQPPG